MSSELGGERDTASTLSGRLRARIKRDGAITFREWMCAALYDEREGYYRRRDLARWGRSGDYRTSPERTPLFAATFARYFASLHDELGSPEEFTIFEAGAGAGHFAHGVIRTLSRDHPRAFSSLRYVVDEASEDACARTAQLLAPLDAPVEFRRIDELAEPLAAGVIFSNELLDAFPVHRVVMRGGCLYELCVGLDDREEFAWVERETSSPLLAEHFSAENVTLDEGRIAEVNLDAAAWIRRAASVLTRGYVVTVDYGAEAVELYGAAHRRAGTLRGYAAHNFAANVLEDPGAQDLTTTIDWTQLMRACASAHLETISLERLDKFLTRVGILEVLERGSQLAETEAERALLNLGAREMILPGGMGGDFQVLVMRKRDGPRVSDGALSRTLTTFEL